jgi:sodium-coupled neutral amino acid transporter 10
MPDHTIRVLTVGIVLVTLTIGLIIPNIELVLGLVGSTAGALVCIIFPSLMFLKVTEGKATTERLMAKVRGRQAHAQAHYPCTNTSYSNI